MSRPDYRKWLQSELDERCRRNPRYSLRAYARDLGMLPSRLSEVLRGNYGLSPEAAEKIATRLGLSAVESRQFRDLVESRHARSRAVRTLAEARVRKSAQRVPARILDLDHFRVIADWYHYAILELTYIRGFESDPAWIAKALGVSQAQIGPALERLKRLGLLETKNGKLRAVEDFTDTPNDIPSDGLKQHHDQILSKAKEAVYRQSIDQRELNAMMFSFSRENMTEARKAIREFRDEFVRRFGGGENRDSVYCLGLQFFELTEKNFLESEK